MGQAAAKGAPAADLRVGNLGHHLVDQWSALGDQWIVLHLPLAGHSPQAQAAVFVRADVEELGDVVQVNEDGRLSQAEVQHRNQALSTGQGLGIIAILGQVGQGFFYCSWCIVFERSWFHGVSTSSQFDCWKLEIGNPTSNLRSLVVV